MLKPHWLILSAAVIALGACSTQSKDSLETASDGSGTSTTTEVTTSNDTGISTDSVPTIIPGSIDDFMLNVSDRVFFAFDRYDLDADAAAVLDRQVSWLRQYNDVDLVIGGHADNRGTREYNLALSERRAQAVRDYLVGLGISADRISVVPYGKERPAVVGDDNAAWAANRRAETKVEPK